MILHIYVDADACPVVRQVEDTAVRHGTAVTLLCDTNHILHSAYSTVRVIGAGADAVGVTGARIAVGEHRRDQAADVDLADALGAGPGEQGVVSTNRSASAIAA